MEACGHETKITARDRGAIFSLLDGYNFTYAGRGRGHVGLSGKARGLLKNSYIIHKIAKKFKPDMLLGIHNPYIAQVGKVLRTPSIIFTDTEHERLAHFLTFPFSDVLCTPSCFEKDLGPKQIRYEGYHELAYLHPNYFEPDASVLERLNLTKTEKFFIFRLVSWEASHDIGQRGFEEGTAGRLIRELESYGKVFITSEGGLSSSLKGYEVSLPPQDMHDLLYYAEMYVGEGGTMASEAAVLGTPSIFVNTLRLGYLNEQENKYGLVYNFSEAEGAMEKALELLENANLKRDWQKKREALLKDKIDVTRFMVDFVTGYPESFNDYRGGKN